MNKNIYCTCKTGHYIKCSIKEKEDIKHIYNATIKLPLWKCQACGKYVESM